MPLPKPTEGELAILRVIWDRGPSTVRQVRDVLHRGRPTKYTTVLKLLQIMTVKGLVTREEEGRKHIYHAGCSETTTQRQLVRDLLDRAFAGSASALVMHALEEEAASPDELKAIEAVLARQKARPAAKRKES